MAKGTSLRVREPCLHAVPDESAALPDGMAGETSGLRADRRRVLFAASGLAGIGLAGRSARAQDVARARPEPGDRLVFAFSANEGKTITADDLTLGGPQVLAWAQEPKSGTVRDGSRLNLVLLIRLDPAELDATAKARSADGILAFSATCTHEQCPVSVWMAERNALHCLCHGSDFDPRQGGRVMAGPAPRALPALPVGMQDGHIVVTGRFTGRVGGQPA